MLKLIEVYEAKDDGEDYEETLIESTNITDPIENAVYVSVNTVEVKVELISQLQVHRIWKLVRSYLFRFINENSAVILRQRTELIV